jgi:tetratricopeptide (TPR) repeat protein
MASNTPIARALALHKAGRLAEAEAAYRELLAVDGRDARALHLLGLVLLSKKDIAAGIRCIRDSIEYGGPVPQRLYDLGSACRAAGDLDAAETAYRGALDRAPTFAPAWSGLGGLLRQRGRLAAAIAALEQSLQHAPDDPRTCLQLASLRAESGDFEGAESGYREVLARAPRASAASIGLGDLLARTGRAADAEAAYRKALSVDPENPDLLAALGECLSAAGRLAEAETALRRTLAIQPGHVRGWFNLGKTLIESDRLDEEFLDAWLSFPGPTPPLVRAAAINHVKQTPGYRSLVQDRDAAGRPGHMDLESAPAREFLAHRILHRLLRRGIVDDLDLERLLTDVRRSILLGVDDPSSMLDFLCGLAEQCFHNEYVFAESAQESGAIDRLAARVDEYLSGSGAATATEVALLAAYRPLHRLVNRRALLEQRAVDEAYARILRQQIAEPDEERALVEAIPRIGTIDDPVSREVRAQYEENPYPRWRYPPRVENRSVEVALTGLFPYLRQADVDWPEAPRVLVAGCGTGHQSVMSALRFRDSSIMAVDLSLASLAYASRKTREAGIGRIEYAQADILRLGEIDERFDLIESTGVLHHMADPLAGWRVLRRLLKPGAFMKIGLYSEHGRRSIVAAREFVAAEGFESTPDGIREARQALGRLPSDHPARQVAERPDFYAMSTCRDMIFHVQEHRLTIGQINEWLHELSLEFVGFELTSSRIARAYLERFPDDPELRASSRRTTRAPSPGCTSSGSGIAPNDRDGAQA